MYVSHMHFQTSGRHINLLDLPLLQMLHIHMNAVYIISEVFSTLYAHRTFPQHARLLHHGCEVLWISVASR